MCGIVDFGFWIGDFGFGVDAVRGRSPCRPPCLQRPARCAAALPMEAPHAASESSHAAQARGPQRLAPTPSEPPLGATDGACPA